MMQPDFELLAQEYERVACAAIGSLLAMRDLAAQGFSAQDLAEFGELTARAAVGPLGLDLNDSQVERLRDENVKFIHDADLLEE